MTNVVPLKTNDPKPAGRATMIAALDIGSAKISCVIAEYKAGAVAPLKVLGLGQTASRGIQAGAISNFNEAERAIRLAVDAAEKSAQRTITEVQVGIAGGKPQSWQYRGEAQVKSGLVQQQDVDCAVSSAVSQAIVGRRSVLSVSPHTYMLDGVEMDRAPLSMNGRRLAVLVNLVTVDAPFLLNIATAVERAHLIPANFVLSSNAAGRACLEADERDMGAAIIDIGHSVTSIGLFRRGRLEHGATIPVAGQHITQDIAKAFSTSIATAERLKTLHGSVLGFGDDESDVLAVPQLGEKGYDAVQQLPKSRLTAVIRPRAEEILELSAQAVLQAGISVDKVIIAGGSASLVGLRELARPIFACDARIGQIPVVAGLQERFRQPSLSVAFGLLSHAIAPDPWCALPSAATAAIERQQISRLRRVGRWIKESF